MQQGLITVASIERLYGTTVGELTIMRCHVVMSPTTYFNRGKPYGYGTSFLRGTALCQHRCQITDVIHICHGPAGVKIVKDKSKVSLFYGRARGTFGPVLRGYRIVIVVAQKKVSVASKAVPRIVLSSALVL